MPGPAALSGAQSSALLARLSWREERGVRRLAAPVRFALPLAAAAEAGSESTHEVKRLNLGGNRCALWLQTSLEPAAPTALSSGTFVVMHQEGDFATVDAAATFQVDDGSWDLTRQTRDGDVIVAAAPGQTSGTGAEDARTEECLWLIGKDWINNGFCYAAASSSRPLSNRGWSVRRKTVPELSAGSVALSTLVTLAWLPYAASCRRRGMPLPAALGIERTLEYRERQELQLLDEHLVARAVGSTEAVPVDVRAQAKAWHLPAIPTLPGATEELEGVECGGDAP